MATRAELEAKRSQALHLTKRANHKISRLRTKVDVEVAGSQYDVRASPKNIRRYTEKQLDAYIARTTQFNDRSTQFVPDAARRPIPASEFRDYKRAEEAHRARVANEYNRVKDLPSVNPHETIGQRRDKMRSDRKMAGNPSTNDPYDVHDRKPRNIANRKALKKLTRDEKKRAQPGWDLKELKRQIGEFSKMVNQIGDADLADTVRSLTPGQFKALWNGGFATAVSMQYELSRKDLISEADKPHHQQLIHDAFTDARRQAEWAKGLDL